MGKSNFENNLNNKVSKIVLFFIYFKLKLYLNNQEHLNNNLLKEYNSPSPYHCYQPPIYTNKATII